MDDAIIVKGRILKRYDDTYYVGENGEIYSAYSRKFLKHNVDHDGYHRVDIHSKHVKVHKLVYLTWVGELPPGRQVNHRDDDKENNNFRNLYAGTQKENIRDCVSNGHRKGNIDHITVYDRAEKKIMTFSPMKDFIEYCGHPSRNGSVKKFFSRNWFRKRFIIIDYGKGCID